MRKRHVVPALAAAALLASATAVLAIDATARVTFIDREAGVVHLNNGDSVIAPADFDLDSLRVAMTVHVTYDETSGEAPYAATAMAIVDAPAAAPADEGAAADEAPADDAAADDGEDDDGM